MSFSVTYTAGGSLDKVKVIKNLETVESVENIDTLGNVDHVKNIEKLESINTMGQLDNVDNMEFLKEVDIVNEIKTIGTIKGFASKTQPYNYMRQIDVPAIRGTIEEEIILPPQEVEILGISVTCSGYAEQDFYDLFVNGQQWFDNWYLGEVKDGLFLGSSTYVYAAPANTSMILKFNNFSGTSKKVWFGIRMLVEPGSII